MFEYAETKPLTYSNIKMRTGGTFWAGTFAAFLYSVAGWSRPKPILIIFLTEISPPSGLVKC
jgi:hypothetical protein